MKGFIHFHIGEEEQKHKLSMPLEQFHSLALPV